ncbi:MAG: hypothetical protein JXB47_20450 [Anaerolineae bacterium]|nr:hypothetical protein [Anaerolineae bacterium]
MLVLKRRFRSVGTVSYTSYQIKVKGWLDVRWADWFDGMRMHHENGPVTVLTGAVPDQVALRGYLCKLWDLGLALISVNPLPESEVQDV